MTYPTTRMRRLRINPQIRDLIRETELTINDLVLPLFIRHGEKIKNPIHSMPGHYQLSIDYLAEEIKAISKLGIPGVILFGIPKVKDALGSDSYHPQGIIAQAIDTIKNLNPEMLVIADTCFCEYTDHGHCGVITHHHGKPQLHNDKTLELLANQAITFAKAGADIIAPSGMIDGMVGTIRQTLDSEGFLDTAILSYAVKYASSFYGPFREAAEGAPKFGDRKTYQMDVANSNEALREAKLDVAEGTDMLMVKPAGHYLDIIYRIKQHFSEIPLGAYQVSGEFAMIKAAAKAGWIDEMQVVMETLIAIKRAGADFIISYFAKECAAWLSAN